MSRKRFGSSDRRGTAYVEYFLAAAAMAGATMWIWTHHMQSLGDDTYPSIRNDIMDEIGGDCGITDTGEIAC